MYNSPEMRRFQYYVMTDWAGGVYASPSMAGSRPGSIIAGAWAVVNTYGVEGYTNSAKEIIGAARHFKDQLQKRFSDDLFVIGDPLLSVVAFGSDSLNIYAVGDRMSKKGWHLNPLHQPAGLHMAFTKLSAASVDKLLDDLAECVAEEKKVPEKGGNLVALYGVGQTAAGPHVVGKVAEMFLDTLYE
jgi:sphinganine-1-phosphate aldolase